jgi:hypothetical protein
VVEKHLDTILLKLGMREHEDTGRRVAAALIISPTPDPLRAQKSCSRTAAQARLLLGRPSERELRDSASPARRLVTAVWSVLRSRSRRLLIRGCDSVSFQAGSAEGTGLRRRVVAG